MRTLAILLAASLVSGCWKHMGEFHGNGQIMVVPGAEDSQRMRMGAWVYFNEDGSILHDEVIDGATYERTGFYQHGKRVRALTEEEIARGIEEGKRITAACGR